MSGNQNVRAIGLACGAADVIAHRFVRATAAGILNTNAAGQDALGVALEGYDHSAFTDGGASNVIAVAQLDGAKIMIEAGAAVAKGAAIMSNNVGQAITAATAGSNILGYANEAAAAAGELIQVVSSKGSQVAA